MRACRNGHSRHGLGLRPLKAGAVALFVACSVPPGAALAQGAPPLRSDDALTAAEMVGRLRRAPSSPAAPELGPRRSIVITTPTPGITASPGMPSERASEPAPPPSLQLRVNFDFDSTRLTDDARQVLSKLGTALKDRELRSDRFLIAGHTDAVGGDAYNQRLSERRAQAVRAFLAASGVEAGRLVTIGYGRSRPADPANRTGGVNRRVEVVNLGP